MIRSILVPLDGSTFGEHALPMAASIARRSGALVHLVHVHQVMSPASIGEIATIDTLDEHLRRDELAYLADVSKRLGQAVAVPIRTALLDGDVVATLRNYAEEHSADLVVMSTHGRGALGRFWLGNVADELARKMPRPVMLIRTPEGKPDLRQDVELRSILLPLDGTSFAERVIEPALTLGEPFNATFTLVRVNKPILRGSYLSAATEAEMPAGVLGEMHHLQEELRRLTAEQRRESQRYLEEMAAKLRGRGVQVNVRVAMNDEPAVGILQEAEAMQADLIAMETHGRRGLSRLFLGSVADKIVRCGPVPVLLSRGM